MPQTLENTVDTKSVQITWPALEAMSGGQTETWISRCTFKVICLHRVADQSDGATIRARLCKTEQSREIGTQSQLTQSAGRGD